MPLDTASIDRIATALYENWGRGREENKAGMTWETLPEHRRDVYREWVKINVLPEVEARLRECSPLHIENG